MTRVYLAGPMTGIPKFNFPLFFEAAAALRAAGIDVVSPAETDPPDVREAALASPDGKYGADGKVGHETWGDMLARDVKFLADGVIDRVIEQEDGVQLMPGNWPVSGIVLLPGWENSKGARLESFVGLLTGKSFALYDPEAKDATEVPAEFVQHQLALAWADGIAMFTPVRA